MTVQNMVNLDTWDIKAVLSNCWAEQLSRSVLVPTQDFLGFGFPIGSKLSQLKAKIGTEEFLVIFVYFLCADHYAPPNINAWLACFWYRALGPKIVFSFCCKDWNFSLC